MAQTNTNPEAKMGSRDKSVSWYRESVEGRLGDAAIRLLETYSKIPADEVEKHIYKIRDEGWEVWPYPCIGQFRFLELGISLNPSYATVLERLKTENETFLDLGCCFGQELRKVVADGVPSDHTYGFDLRPEFFDLGYKLFLDKDSLKTKFIAGDIFDPACGLSALDGKIDVIYVGSFLHLFNYEKQVEVCKRMVKLLRDKKDSMVLGRQVGDAVAKEYPHRTDGGGMTMFRHNEESFKKMWDEVGNLTGTKWRVEALASPVEDGWMKGNGNSSAMRLKFTVFRL